MVQILEPVPRFGSEFGKALGKGLAGGAEKYLEAQKEKERQETINRLLGIQPQQNDEKLLQNFLAEHPGIEQEVGRKLTPQDMLDVYSSMQKGKQLAGSQVNPLERAKATALMGEKDISNILVEEAKMQEKTAREERGEERKRAYKVIEESDEASKTLPIRKNDLAMSRQAILEGDLSGMTNDYLAEIFNYEPLRTAKGAQLKSTTKDMFVKNIQSVGSRPNQWVEQQIDSAMVKLGKSREANLTIIDLGQFQLDVEEARLNAIHNLEDQYRKELGYIPGTIGKDADKLIKPYVEQRQKQLAYDLRKTYEEEQGEKALKKIKKVPKGTPLTVEKARVLVDRYGDNAEKVARSLGYDITEEEIYSRE